MPKTLLLADDSKTIQQAVGMTFAREDLQVSSVDDGEAALQAAKQSKPDVILADVSMPRLGGYELCQRIRADAALKDVPVLLLGGPTPIDPAKAMAVGANGHMPKPFDSAKLIEHVKTILANPKAKPAMAAAVTSGPPRPSAVAPAPARPPVPPPPPARPGVSPGGAGGTMVMARPPMPAAAPSRPTSTPPAARPPAPPPRPATTPAPPAGARPPPPAPAMSPRPPAPAAASPSAPPPRAPPPPARPPAAARPPQPPVLEEDEEDIPLDVEEVSEELEAPAPTPLRPVASAAHKPSLSVVPPPGDGGEALLRDALSRASREVIEKIAWEVVPELAETIIREELERLIKERGA